MSLPTALVLAHRLTPQVKSHRFEKYSIYNSSAVLFYQYSPLVIYRNEEFDVDKAPVHDELQIYTW